MSPSAPVRAYCEMNVSVASRIVAPLSRMRRTISFGCSGEGWKITLIPAINGSSAPTVRPKQWKVGSGLNTMSVSGLSPICARTCSTFAMTFSWLSTTPFGSPSVPEVNRITPGCLWFSAAPTKVGSIGPAIAESLSPIDSFSRTSSK